MILLTSCYSTKRLIRENNFPTKNLNIKNLSGIYSNNLKKENSLMLWKTLKSSHTFKNDTLVYSNSFVELTLFDNENLNVKLLNKADSKIIEEFNLRGKIKGDFFSIDRNLTLIPFPPIYYLNKESKTLIANDDFGNLIVVKGQVREGMVLFMAGGNKGVSNYKFERIKN